MVSDKDRLDVLGGLSLFKEDGERKATQPAVQRLIDEANADPEDDDTPEDEASESEPDLPFVDHSEPGPLRDECLKLTGQLVELRRQHKELHEHSEQRSEIRLSQGKLLNETQGENARLKGTNSWLRREHDEMLIKLEAAEARIKELQTELDDD